MSKITSKGSTIEINGKKVLGLYGRSIGRHLVKRTLLDSAKINLYGATSPLEKKK